MFGWKNMSCKLKIVLPVALLFIVLAVILTVYTGFQFMSHCEDMMDDKNMSDVKALTTYIGDCKTFSRAAAAAMTYNPELIKNISNRDRKALLEFLTPMHELYHVNFFTITDETGSVILRSYLPDVYGDDISYQKNISDALRGDLSTTIESGTHIKVAIRTAAPVYDANCKLVGVISAGVRLDRDELVDGLKEVFNSEATVFEGDTRIATTIVRDGKRAIGTSIPPEVAKVVFEERDVFDDEVEILGVTYKAVYVPLINPNDSVFAAIFLGHPVNDHKDHSVRTVLSIVLVNSTGMAIALLILYLIISSLCKPLGTLAKNIDEVERGNFDVDIDTDSEDEIGRVSRSLSKLVGTVRELVNGANMIVQESKKGKTHRMDIDSFQGECRVLAERIAELSDFSATDKLTGLANRRTFDARLQLEWNRALRDGTKLSLLMIDIDHFKKYNDSHGHRQGDVALQAVASVLTKFIKRGVDLAARWGGEEFAVLLPNTDTSGAMTVASKIHSAVRNAEVPSIDGGKSMNVTVSIGLYTCAPTAGSHLSELITKADNALYSAKHDGRDRISKYGAVEHADNA